MTSHSYKSNSVSQIVEVPQDFTSELINTRPGLENCIPDRQYFDSTVETSARQGTLKAILNGCKVNILDHRNGVHIAVT